VNYKSVIDNLNILDYDYYFKLTDAIIAEDVAKALLIFDEILGNGFDGNHFITGLASHFRNLLVCKDASTLKLLEVSEGIKQKYNNQSQAASLSFLISALNISNQCDLNYKTSKNQRLQVELTLIKLCHIAAAVNLSAAGIPAMQDGQLKKKLKSVEESPVPSPVSPIKAVENPIAAISVLNPESEKKIQVIENKPIEPIQEAPKLENPKIAVIPKLTVGLNSSLIPNLNDLGANYSKKEDIEAEYLSGESKVEFNSDMMLNCWNTYAEKIKKDGKINVFTIMTAYPPLLLDNYIIEFYIENKIQEDLLVSEKVDLLNYLRVQLKNFSIDIQTKQVEQTQKNRLYTSSEKYEHMLQKNPNLEEFKRRLNLDLDY
jgi:DNA polymerase-3 subunit gamma/tau